MLSDFPRPAVLDAPTCQPASAGELLAHRVQQVLCGLLHGHDSLPQFEQDRLFLKCVSCGHESPGWALNEIARPVPVPSDGRRRGRALPHLVSARRIA